MTAQCFERGPGDHWLRQATWRRLMIATIVGMVAYGLGTASASAAVVTVTLDGSAKGSVTSSPAGINCSNIPDAEKTECSFDFGFQFLGITLSAAGADGAALLHWTGNVAGTCSGGTNPCLTGSIGLDPLAVAATFLPEPDKPVVATGAASEVSFPSAVLSGTVNPNSADFGISDCYFEYGPSAAYGLKAPCLQGTPGPGTDAISVTGEAALLEPNTIYHYRMVAVNAGGRRAGADKTFTSATAPADACPNAALRAQQGAIAQRLPECLAYELVTPPSTAGEPALLNDVGGTGNDVLFNSVGGFADVENLMSLGALYRAQRTPDGWSTSAVGGPPSAEFPFYSVVYEWTADWWKVDRPLTLWGATPAADLDKSIQMVGRKGGPWHPVSPSLNSQDIIPLATSTDLSGVVLHGTARPPLTDGTTDTRRDNFGGDSLTVTRRNADGTLEVRQVAQQNGETFLPDCGIQIGTSNNGVRLGAIARDGLTRIVFSPTTSPRACRAPELQRVWVSDPFSANPDAFDASASRCTTDCGTPETIEFVGGSLDASRLYMTTAEKLLDADIHPGVDLYEYDFSRPDSERLRLVTGNDTPANVLGSVAVSDDGSRVYFVASGQLSGAVNQGTEPVLGSPNLYVRTTDPSGDNSVTRFLATLSSSDSSQWGVFPSFAMTPDARYLAFTSEAALTPDKLAGDTLPDVYRIDGDTGDIVRAWTDSPEHNGSNRKAGVIVGGRNANGNYTNRQSAQGASQISDDGSAIYFTSAEPVAHGDVNNANDAFVWSAATGEIAMVSDGRDPAGVNAGNVSADGSTFLFNTSSRLIPQHTSTSIAMYAVRRDGGFPVPEPPAVPCAGEACQGTYSSAPSLPSVGSVSFGGDGNVDPASRPRPARIRVSRPKAFRGAAARLRVRVSGAGRIRVGGPWVRRSGRSASKAGIYRVRVALKPRARKVLRKRTRLTVRARVVFRAEGGRRATKRIAVTFKRSNAKRAKTRKGGR